MNDLKKILGSLNGDTIISDDDIRSLCAEIESHRRTIDIGTAQIKIAQDALAQIEYEVIIEHARGVARSAVHRIKYGTP